MELKSVCIYFKSDLNITQPKLKYICENQLIDCYLYLLIMLRIVFTLLVLVASNERSFTKLKLIKIYHQILTFLILGTAKNFE